MPPRSATPVITSPTASPGIELATPDGTVAVHEAELAELLLLIRQARLSADADRQQPVATLDATEGRGGPAR